MIYKTHILLFLVLLIISDISNAQVDYEKYLDILLADNFEPNGPGCSVVIVKNGKIIYANSIGIGNLELSTSITKSSTFLLGSVGKQFTAYAIATLIENGTIKSNDYVKKYLPNMPNYSQQITVEDLIHHKSGLIEQYSLLIYEGYRLQDAITKQDVMRVLSGQNELDFSPGTNYTYSNSNYRLLAEIVESASSMSFELYVKKNIFDKLGMKDSNFINDLSEIIPNKVPSYQPNGNNSYSASPYNGSTTGSTGLWSTSEDLEKWLKHLVGLKNEHPAIYSRIKTISSLKDGTAVTYGYGWEVDELFGKELLYHNGVDAGYNTQVYFFPNEELGIAVLSNNNKYSFDFANQIAAVFLDESEFKEATSNEEVEPIKKGKPVKLSNSEVQAISGKYELGDGSILVVKEEDYKLYRSIEDRPDEELLATSANTVYYKNRPEVELRFSSLNKKNNLFDGFHLAFNDTEVEYCKRISEPDRKTLQSLLGNYKHPSLNIEISVQLIDDKLTLNHYKHGKMLLNPTSTALEFSGTDWWINRISFRKNSNNNLSLHLLNPPSGERFNGIRLEKTKS